MHDLEPRPSMDRIAEVVDVDHPHEDTDDHDRIACRKGVFHITHVAK